MPDPGLPRLVFVIEQTFNVIDAFSISATCMTQLRHAKEYEWYKNFNLVDEVETEDEEQSENPRQAQEIDNEILDWEDNAETLEDVATADELDKDKKRKERKEEIRPKTYRDIRDVALDDEPLIGAIARLQAKEWFINVSNIF